MSKCGEHKNPLKRGGTSQPDRLLDGLRPTYVKVDEHDYPDWITFANAFAGFLDYFDDTNMASGDWRPFLTSDISSQLGSIAIQDIETYRDAIKKRFDFLKSDDNRIDTLGLEKNLNELFSSIFTLASAMDEYRLKLPDTVTLKNTLLNLIQSKLAPSLNRLISYHKEAESLTYLAHLPFDSWKVLNKQLTDAVAVIADGLSDIWIYEKPGENFADWNDYVANIPDDLGIFVTSLADDVTLTDEEREYLRIQHAANHNLFSGIFDQFLFAFAKIVAEASEELKKTLTDWNSHQPNYALFIAFLKLFKFAQQQANTITGRHLDFYYKEVLQLKPREALPNKANVLVELAKQVDSYLLAKGTGLKAGKDSIGKDVTYALDNDTTFNKAKVTSLSAVYFAAEGDSIYDYTDSPPPLIENNKGRLYASPVVNSEDGLGAELKSPNKEWHPYVHKEYKEEVLSAIAMPKASIGFAIASHYLYLTEGERQVFIKIFTDSNSLLDNNIECYLTTAKDWFRVDTPITVNASSMSESSPFTEIIFTLGGDKPSIENYNPAVHGGTLHCALPVAKFIITQPADPAHEYKYNSLKDLVIESIEVTVAVGMNISGSDPLRFKKGLKQLSISNDGGPLDASKPFMPFGPNPNKDAGFVIGNKEIFTKKNLQLTANIEWANHPGASSPYIDYERQYIPNVSSTGVVTYTAGTEGTYAPKVYINYLSSGIWNVLGSPIDIFLNPALQNTSIVNTSLPDTFYSDYDDPYLALNSTTNRGFIRFILERDFGFKAYIADLTQYLIEQSSDVTPKQVPVKPTEPYTPVIQSLYLSYSAFQATDLTSLDANNFNNREIRFYHIYPFGDAEQHQYLNDINGITDDVYLLPQFRHLEKNEDTTPLVVPHVGEFYIGIGNLKADDAVNILFQVMEGTTDPQVSKPADHIKWSYLSNNYWIDFTEQQISDATLALLQSGIISFAISSRATITNTLLPAGKIWIRAAIKELASAIPQMLSVDAQAAVCTFKPNDNADDFLNAPLKAGTITKLKTPDSAIKKIDQKYNSFGGRPREIEDHFYMRASERLRHKARAITIWDYEHLILEEFPGIYRVKCLNHTGVAVDEEDGKEYTNELKPGHVLIITIPQLRNRNETNILKPYTNQDVLTNIENFLRKKVSAFITVKARQPLFEEVGISFSLKLYDQYKDFTFYSTLLQEEITRYLTPWAYESDADVKFGGKIYKSSLINFIEERYYVDYIEDVVLSQKIGDDIVEDETIEEINASTARSILVSMPAWKHLIHRLDATGSSETTEECSAVSR